MVLRQSRSEKGSKLRHSRSEKGSNWPFAADCEFRNGRARVVRNSLHHETLSILSIVIGPDSVSGCAFVGRLSGPQLNRYRTAALPRELAGVGRRITDRRIGGVNVGAPN